MTNPELLSLVPVPVPDSNQPYRVLARKYRPKTFQDLIGQETLVSVMNQAITASRVPHAMILTGVRGVGKTTSARIIARSLNCVGVDGLGAETLNPCGVCDPCEAILEDRFVDVIEMDAASRTGVDDIRSLIETAQYRPVSGRFKVFIIDEVHMLSKNAFNALLKTLEEPPLHVKFIFATTEIRKVPDTVLSRCVRFDLRRLTPRDILVLYARVLKAEGVQADDGALQLLARQADGSARDALSLLDQAINLSPNLVTETAVRHMLHLTDGKAILDLFQALIAADLQTVLEAPRNSYARGGDPITLLQDLANLCHELSLLKAHPALVADTFTNEERLCLEAVAQDVSIPVLARLWQGFLKGIQETELHPQPLRSAEMVLLRLAHLSLLPTPYETLEALKTGKIAQPDFPTTPNVSAAEPAGILPKTFVDLVKLVGEKREPVMQATLRHDVHLVTYQPGNLVLKRTPRMDREFIATLRQKLTEWTQFQWVVTCEDIETGGDPTLQEQTVLKYQQTEAQIKQDPLFKEALAVFPKAHIESINIGDSTE